MARHSTPTGLYRGTTHERILAARQLRTTMTPAEQTLWQSIRRQHPIGPFILDFCCPEHNLVIEVDGPIHEAQQDYDTTRTLHLESYGYRVLRFTNDEVQNNLNPVLQAIIAALNSQAESPLPPGVRGEGGWGVRGPFPKEAE
jgi:very-short-patch-repair endonuclease